MAIDLLQLRDQLDDIDEQIVHLYERNGWISAGRWQSIRSRTASRCSNKEREKSKLQTLKAMASNDFYRHGVEELFEQIMSMSRKLQYQLLSKRGVIGRLPFMEVDSLKQASARVVFREWRVLTARLPCVPISVIR